MPGTGGVRDVFGIGGLVIQRIRSLGIRIMVGKGIYQVYRNDRALLWP